MSGTPTEKGG